MKAILLTGGGSSGHVTPNIALLNRLKESDFSIYYVGSENGIERQLIENEGIPYYHIKTGKLRRYFSVKNITDAFRVIGGLNQSISIIRKLKPDILFSKGGFVSCPVVWAAWLCKVPIVIHESDITPGLTNRLSMPFARKVCFTFPESSEHISRGKGVLTGIPIRSSLLEGDKFIGQKICGFRGDKPVLLIVGGSQGSVKINEVIRSILDTLLKDFNICHICGKGNIDDKLKSIYGYIQFEYVGSDLPHLFALSDITISRAGATTLFELLALRKPNLLIPLSKNASRGDQILNAESFKNQGYSMVIHEEELSGTTLIQTVEELFKNKEKYQSNMAYSNLSDSIDKIIEVIRENSK